MWWQHDGGGGSLALATVVPLPADWRQQRQLGLAAGWQHDKLMCHCCLCCCEIRAEAGTKMDAMVGFVCGGCPCNARYKVHLEPKVCIFFGCYNTPTPTIKPTHTFATTLTPHAAAAAAISAGSTRNEQAEDFSNQIEYLNIRCLIRIN